MVRTPKGHQRQRRRTDRQVLAGSGQAGRRHYHQYIQRANVPPDLSLLRQRPSRPDARTGIVQGVHRHQRDPGVHPPSSRTGSDGRSPGRRHGDLYARRPDRSGHAEQQHDPVRRKDTSCRGHRRTARAKRRLTGPLQGDPRELHEETAVPPEKVSSILCLGLVRDRNTVQPELIFDCHVDCDVVSLFASAATAPDAAEHSSMVPVRDHPGAVVSFMEQHFSQLTPVAMATLLLHGLRHWGSGWFATARGYLRSVI